LHSIRFFIPASQRLTKTEFEKLKQTTSKKHNNYENHKILCPPRVELTAINTEIGFANSDPEKQGWSNDGSIPDSKYNEIGSY